MTWTPENINSLSAATVLIISAAAFIIAQQRGWIVIGWVHRTFVKIWEQRDVEKDEIIRAQVHAIETLMETNRNQAGAIAKFADHGDMSERLLVSVRDLAQEGTVR